MSRNQEDSQQRLGVQRRKAEKNVFFLPFFFSTNSGKFFEDLCIVYIGESGSFLWLKRLRQHRIRRKSLDFKVWKISNFILYCQLPRKIRFWKSFLHISSDIVRIFAELCAHSYNLPSSSELRLRKNFRSVNWSSDATFQSLVKLHIW